MAEQIDPGSDSQAQIGKFRFFHPIEIRYRDVDAQRHVNSAVYFTYLEQARANYLQLLGLWKGEDFDQIGIILAEQSCTYRAPIYYGQQIEIGLRCAHIGEKSMKFEYLLRERSSHAELAVASTILVAYSYGREESIAVPEDWRRSIEAYEGGSDDRE
jgi:acyl-CoA thioester hydrolase